MRKIIIILIITLATFMGGNIYTNNEQRLSENITKISDDNTIISEENTIISESFDENIGKLSDNSEIQKELNISNDKENERITPEENNVSLTLDNATEEKKKDKITKEEKRVEEPKEEKIEVSQPKEEPKVIETKPEPIKEPEPVTPKCDGSNHGIGVGNSIGLTRLFYQLNELNAIKADKESISEVLVIPMGQEDVSEALKVANSLREAGINTDIYLDEAKIKKKMKYADKWQIPFAIIIGEEERETKLYTLKNMKTGEQIKTALNEIASRI